MGIKKRGRSIIALLAVVLLIALGVSGGWLEADKRDYNASHAYPLLDPSVSQPAIHQEIINFDPLRQNIKQYLGNLNVKFSFYFEYLPNGVNIRDGEDQSSVAASLMKTPVVMDLYKLAEQGQLNLNSKATVQQKDISTDPDYGNYLGLTAGQTITLRQAAETTLHYSDNTTVNVIRDAVLPLLDSSNDAIQSLDVSYTVSGNTPDTEVVSISARSYSSILKCLYYSCFDNPKDSSEMLGYLTGSAGQARLTSGVPKNIQVAHKIGSSSTGQSDCGIIYDPGKPYLMCLMFWNLPDGTNYNKYFQTVSQMTYSYITNSKTESW